MGIGSYVESGMRTSVVKVTSYSGRNLAGAVYNGLFGGFVSFSGTTELILTIERLLDDLGSPKSTEKLRVFGRPAPVAPTICGEPKSALATFELRVLFRRNSSWQGELRWAETGKSADFRSVLELVRLMDSALAPE